MTTNTRLKVTPGSRSNFTKLKKFKGGGGIPKFEEPWRKTEYLTEDDSKLRAVDTSTWGNYYKMDDIKAKVPEFAKDWTLEALNNADLYDPNLTWNAELNKPGYLKWNTAFDALPGFNQNIFKSNAATFDLLGPTTFNRHKTLEEMQNTYTSSNPLTIKDGKKVYWDGTKNLWVELSATDNLAGAAAIKSDGASVDGTDGVVVTGTENDTPEVEVTEDGTIVERTRVKGTKKEKKPFRFPMYPLYNAAKLGNALLGTLRSHNWAMNQQVALDTPTLYTDTIQGDYVYLKAAQEQMAKNNALGARFMSGSSDLTLNMQGALAANELNSQIALQAAQHLSDTFLREMLEANKIANFNTEQRTDTANTNRLRLIALDNALLKENQNFDLNKSELMDLFMTSMRTDTVNDNKTQYLNQHLLWLNKNQPIHDKVLAGLRARIKTDLDPVAFYEKYYLEFKKNTKNPIFSDLATEYDNGEHQVTFEDFMNHYYSGKGRNSAIGKQMASAFTKQYNNAYDRYYTDANAETAHWNSVKGAWPLLIDGELPYWWTSRNAEYTLPYTPIPFAKDGGTVIKIEDKNRDRFLKYIENNRKITEKSIENAMKHVESNRAKLKRDLDALDAETLLLLKAIFK